MQSARRSCRLADRTHKGVDLTQYADLIIDTINNTVPNRNPEVLKDRFLTDLLTHSEAVRLGQALVKVPELKQYGREVTQYRLFEGKVESGETSVSKAKRKPRGGRKHRDQDRSAEIREH